MRRSLARVRPGSLARGNLVRSDCRAMRRRLVLAHGKRDPFALQVHLHYANFHDVASLVKAIEGLFVQVLLLAREMGVLNMGTIGLDGTKIHANASRHSALSYEHAGKIEAQLQAEVAELMAKAEAADAADIPDGISIPDELARREERLRKIAEARTKIEARAKERHARDGARDGGVSSQTRGARRQDCGHGQEAWRQAATASNRGASAERSD